MPAAVGQSHSGNGDLCRACIGEGRNAPLVNSATALPEQIRIDVGTALGPIVKLGQTARVAASLLTYFTVDKVLAKLYTKASECRVRKASRPAQVEELLGLPVDQLGHWFKPLPLTCRAGISRVASVLASAVPHSWSDQFFR